MTSLALAHLREPERDDREKWKRRAGDYLRLAASPIGDERP
jgi:hypothetical protein